MKAAITLGLLTFLAAKLEWAPIAARLHGASAEPLIAALVIVTVAVPLAALRWMMLARAAGAAMSPGLAVKLNFAGMFFGQVLPASIGGDVVRGWLACRSGLAWPPVVSSLVLDRIIALAAAVILILIALPWLAGLAGGAMTLTALVSAAVVALLIGGLFVDLLPWPSRFKSRRLVGRVLELIAVARRGLFSASGVSALAVSILIHVMTIFAVAEIGLGLGLDDILVPSALVVPTAMVAAAIPVSLNGWGIREGVMVAGFAVFGIAQADAFLVSVLLGFAVVLSALPGGFTWLMLR